MLNLLIRILLAALVLVGVLALIGSFLPRGYEFQTELTIKAKPATIFPMVNTPRNWQKWSMWSPEKVVGLKVEYRGNESGVGAEQFWTEIRGAGKMWITASQPERSIEYKMVFANFPQMNSTILLEPNGDSTDVKWKSSGRLPSGPFYGYFAWLFGSQMKYQYQTALENLSEFVEKN